MNSETETLKKETDCTLSWTNGKQLDISLGSANEIPGIYGRVLATEIRNYSIR